MIYSLSCGHRDRPPEIAGADAADEGLPVPEQEFAWCGHCASFQVLVGRHADDEADQLPPP